MQLPEPYQQQAQAGQPAPGPTTDQARQLIDAVNDALAARPTAYRDDTPVPVVGSTPAVSQPGRPPMSQKATDASALMLSFGVASLPVGAAITGVLWASGGADPIVVACLCAAPAGLILALSRLAGRAKGVVEAAPPMHHHHYTGPVDQRSITTHTRGVIANTRNQTPN